MGEGGGGWRRAGGGGGGGRRVEVLLEGSLHATALEGLGGAVVVHHAAGSLSQAAELEGSETGHLWNERREEEQEEKKKMVVRRCHLVG